MIRTQESLTKLTGKMDETTPLLKGGPPHPHPHQTNKATDLKSPEASSSSLPPARRHWLSLVTVEPALFFCALAISVESVFKDNMLVDKTCSIQLHYSQDVCKNLDSGDYEQQQDTVQKITNQYNLYCMLIEYGPAVLVMIFLGTLSDTRGRRLPLMLPMIGSTLKALGLIVNAHWWSLEPYYVLLSYIPYGLTGSIMAAFMAAYAYVSEDSDPKWRTTRLSIASVMMFTAKSASYSLGALLYSHWGYTAVFGCDFFFSFMSFLYVIVRFREEPPKSVARGREGEEGEEGGKVTMLAKMKHTVMVVLKKRENGVRAKILGHISCICLYLITAEIKNFLFLYTRKRFAWTYYEYSIWILIGCPFSIIGLIFLLPFLSNYCHLPDEIVSFVGSASYSFYGIIIGTAPASWLMYLALVVSTTVGIPITASRGALSKMVASDELGAVLSVVGLGEALMPLLSSPMYTFIYNNTLDIFPGTIFVMSGGFSLIICCMYTWLATAFLPRDNGEQTVLHQSDAESQIL